MRWKALKTLHNLYLFFGAVQVAKLVYYATQYPPCFTRFFLLLCCHTASPPITAGSVQFSSVHSHLIFKVTGFYRPVKPSLKVN